MTNSTIKLDAKSKPRGTGRTTKKDQLIKLLGAKAGADIKSLSEKFGWQQHTTRAAISRLRKVGYEIAGEQPAKGGMSKFRILSVPTARESATVVGAANGA